MAYDDINPLTALEYVQAHKYPDLYEEEDIKEPDGIHYVLCADSIFIPRGLKPGVINHECLELFMYGQDHALAYVLNREYGMELYYIKHLKAKDFVHFLCRDPKTNHFLDITGARTIQEYRDELLYSDDDFIFIHLKNDLKLKKYTRPIIWFAKTVVNKVLKYLKTKANIDYEFPSLREF